MKGNNSRYVKEIVSLDGKIKKGYSRNPEKAKKFLKKINGLMSSLDNSKGLLLETRNYIITSQIKSLEGEIASYRAELEDRGKIEYPGREPDTGRTDKDEVYLSVREMAEACGKPQSFIRSMHLKMYKKEGHGRARRAVSMGDVVTYLLSGHSTRNKKEAAKSLSEKGYASLVDEVGLKNKKKGQEKTGKEVISGISTDDELIEFGSACSYLGVSVGKFAELLDKKKIKEHGIKGRNYFKKSELDDVKANL